MEHGTAFARKVQTLLLQQEFMEAIKANKATKVKEILCNPELDINYLYSYSTSDLEVIEIIKIIFSSYI